jgi:hypothetical protein
MGKVIFIFISQILNMGKVFFVFRSAHRVTDPEYMGKVFFCFLVCTKVLNMRKVLEFSGLHTGPEHENGFSIIWCARRS